MPFWPAERGIPGKTIPYEKLSHTWLIVSHACRHFAYTTYFRANVSLLCHFFAPSISHFRTKGGNSRALRKRASAASNENHITVVTTTILTRICPCLLAASVGPEKAGHTRECRGFIYCLMVSRTYLLSLSEWWMSSQETDGIAAAVIFGEILWRHKFLPFGGETWHFREKTFGQENYICRWPECIYTVTMALTKSALHRRESECTDTNNS